MHNFIVFETFNLRKFCSSKFRYCLSCDNFCFENNPLYGTSVVCTKNFKAIASLLYLVRLFKYCKSSFFKFFKNDFELQLLILSFIIPSILHQFKNPSTQSTFKKGIRSGKSFSIIRVIVCLVGATRNCV